MSVQSTTLRADYTGNGLTKVFVVPFYFIDNDHVKLILTDNVLGTVTTLTLGTDYSLDGVGTVYGGAATLGTAPTSTQKLSILRDIPYTQLFHYVPNDPFPAESHESALDNLTMQVQQLAEIVNRSLRLNSNDPTSGELPIAQLRAGGYLFFDSNGEPQINTAAPWGLKIVHTRATSTLNQTVFSVPQYTPGADNLIVSAGGFLLEKDVDYTETNGLTITLLSPSPAGIIYTFRALSSFYASVGTPVSAAIAPLNVTGLVDGANQSFTFSSSTTPNILVFAGGVFQTPGTDYSAPVLVSGTIWRITFTNAPANGPITVLLLA